MADTRVEHGITIAAELIAVLHSFLVGLIDEVVAAKGALAHHHGRFRMVEVGHHGVSQPELVGREDELIGPALVFLQHPVGTHGGLRGAGRAGANDTDAVAVELGLVHDITEGV